MIVERRVALSVVCDLNNGAVDLLAAGRLDLAQVVFTEAIQATTKLMQEESDPDHNETCARNSFDTKETSFDLEQLFQSSILNICHGKILSNVGHGHSSEDEVFVYQRAFKLRYDQYIPPLETICIIILYNMGIGFHTYGTPSCSHQTLELAARYYGLALSACGGGKESDMHAVPPTLRLAILNNLGEIYFRLSRYENMVSVNDYVKTSWCYVRIAVLVGGPFLNQAEMHGLQCNIMFLRKPEMAAAA